MAGWFLSPSGWPTYADTTREGWELTARGYDPLADDQVQAAIDAFRAAEAAPPPSSLPGWALAADVAAALATKANASSLGGKLSISDIGNPATSGGAALRAAFGPLPGKTDKTRVLVVGSSNAAGVGASTTANSWVGRLAANWASTHTFINVAVSGISPTYWVTPDATTGRSPLEQAIIDNQPHIVIAAFTAQNSGGPTATFPGWVDQAINTCKWHGIRCVAITPYNSNGYTSAQRDTNAWIGRTLKARGVWVLNFGAIWGLGATIPAAIDSGDGLHLNDLGHMEQSRQIPRDYLSLTSVMEAAPRFDTGTAGLLVPSGTTGAVPLSLSAFPGGSWTVGFEVTLPSVDLGGIALLSFPGSNSTTRLRIPGPNRAADVAGGITLAPTADMATGTTHHLTLSYDAITLESKLYLDGVLQSTATASAGLTFTGLSLGSKADTTSPASTYKFRNLTVHATVLGPVDVVKLSNRQVPPASLFVAAGLDDAPARPVGALLSTLFGETAIPTLGVATA